MARALSYRFYGAIEVRRFSAGVTSVALPALAALLSLGAATFEPRSVRAQSSSPGTWSFAVSGDSRNCGDVVMPAIAAGVRAKGASFYWHLGDFRAIYTFDEDIQHQPEHLHQSLTVSGYLSSAWDDFIQNQIVPFSPVPVYLGIGNHDLIPPKTRPEYIQQFADWLDTPVLQAQRLRDDFRDHKVKTYFHWQKDGVDFVSLDNATDDQFDAAQMRWFSGVIERDSADASIHTIVAGMHEALPDSISANHSMDQSAQGIESGRAVYKLLLKAQDEAHKRVYVLASHSHYFMDGIFKTDYWHANGGVLPGWIIGTAGAVRYALPPEKVNANAAETNVYGFLLATVEPDGTIHFAFQKLAEGDVPAPVAERYTPEFVQWCFQENSSAK
jgi:hypothetical protein